jgi:hypothetical protein
MKNYKLIPKIALIVLAVLGVLFVLLFVLGGNSDKVHEIAGKALPIPLFTDPFLIWVYIIVIVSVLTTLWAAGASFIDQWKHNRRGAYTAIGVICGLVLLFVICWFLGSGKEVKIVGYTDGDNVGFWAQLSDMVIYACYFLAAATIGTVIWGIVHTKRLK